MSNDVIFSRVDINTGVVTDVRTIQRGAILACPHVIMAAEHYREDGSCKCSNAEHRAMMIAEWEYSEADFDGIALTD